MANRRFRLLASSSFSLLMLAAACSSGPEVRTQRSPQADLANYKTYAWAPQSQLEQPKEFSQRPNDILDQQIKGETNQWLQNKGLTQSAKNPDLQVAYSVRTQDQLKVTPGFYPEPYYSYWNTAPTDRVVQERKGTLTIDLLDAHTGKLVWRGVAVSDVDELGQKPEQIHEAINKILQTFPSTSQTNVA